MKCIVELLFKTLELYFSRLSSIVISIGHCKALLNMCQEPTQYKFLTSTLLSSLWQCKTSGCLDSKHDSWAVQAVANSVTKP